MPSCAIAGRCGDTCVPTLRLVSRFEGPSKEPTPNPTTVPHRVLGFGLAAQHSSPSWHFSSKKWRRAAPFVARRPCIISMLCFFLGSRLEAGEMLGVSHTRLGSHWGGTCNVSTAQGVGEDICRAWVLHLNCNILGSSSTPCPHSQWL